MPKQSGKPLWDYFKVNDEDAQAAQREKNFEAKQSRLARTWQTNRIFELQLGMYRIVILPDILLIEPKPDSRISCNFLQPDSNIRLENTGYLA